MPYYTRPDVYVEEVNTTEGPVRAAQTGRGGMQAVTERGPVGVPIRTRNFASWKKVFGGYELPARGDAAFEAKSFFDEGGFELVTVRQAHYSDVDDPTTVVAPSSRTHLAESTGATAAEKQSAVGPFDFLSGGDLAFTVSIDNEAAVTPTVAATAGYLTSSNATTAGDQDTKTLLVSIDGGPTQTITFSGTTDTAALMADQINQQILGASAYVDSSEVVMKSDRQGSGSSVIIISGGTTDLTWTTTYQTGTGNVSDLSAVTATEMKAICDALGAAFTDDGEAIVNADGSFTIRSLSTGVASELDFTDACSVLGFSVEVINGTAAGTSYSTLKLYAGYRGHLSPGVFGDTLKSKAVPNPLRASAGAGSDIAADITSGDTAVQMPSLAGLSENSVVTVIEGLNTEYKTVTGTRTVVSGSSVEFYIDVDSAFTNSYTQAGATLQTNEFDLYIYEGTQEVESWTALSMLDTSDQYVETILNDDSIGSEYVFAEDLDAACGIGADTPVEDTVAVALSGGSDETASLAVADWIGSITGGTGMYAWGTVTDFMPICTPGMNESVVVHQMALYCKSRIYFEYLTYVPQGYSGDEAVAFRNNTIGVDSDCSAMYAGGIEVYNPIGTGSNPRRQIQGLGALMGIRARVDSLPGNAGGPWETPAGEGDYGTVNYALDVATEYRDDETGAMNEVGINVIRKFGSTNPVTVWGGRTLSTNPTKRFVYINVRRFFQYVEKSIADSTRWAIHRNNNFKLWSKLEDRVSEFLVSLMAMGAFPTSTKDLAFYVKVGTTKGTMTQADIDNGLVKGEVGLAPNKPGEFLVWTFTQYDSGWEVAE